MEGLEAMSLSENLSQMDIAEKTLLKTHLQVELNEEMQEKMEGSMFEDLDDFERSQFIGNMFKWVRN